jgi:multiple sugar transport system substrate-binding protein
MTWKHDRGLAPMLATAAEFCTEHPGVLIEWEARSLYEFGEAPLAQLAEQYDLLVIDHPFMGQVAMEQCLLPLDHCVSGTELQKLERDSVGQSHGSYFFQGHQWALAIDAAAQVAGFRPDLLEKAGAALPKTWNEVFDLGRIRRGFVSAALWPVDAIICFFTFCANYGEPPFASPGQVVNNQVGQYALESLRKLLQCSLPEAPTMNPIAVWERMSSSDDVAYCPLAFGYSNYSRDGYRHSLISFGVIPSSNADGPIGATLGGAGIAISRNCTHPEIAAAYALWVAGADCQRTLYVDSGGQPGHRSAWLDDHANRITNRYFIATLPVLEHAWLRPRSQGFVAFQAASAEIIARHLGNALSARETLELLNRTYQRMVDPGESSN